MLLKKIIGVTIVLCFISSMLRGQEFTIGTIPDTQNLTEKDSLVEKITEITKWYVDHRKSLNIKFVASLGDMTQWGAPEQWLRVRKSYDLFKNAKMPYAPCQGNHEPDLSTFSKYFPVSEFETLPTYGGHLEGMYNAYYLFSAAGVDYIIIVIRTHDQFIGVYDMNSINWANEILDKYATRRAIFITHDFSENKSLINDVIKKHDNLFLAICGHSCAREKYWTEISPAGNKIHCIMTDYQCDSDKGATLRYYTFKPSENKICAFTYNITKHAFETGANSQFCFKSQIAIPVEPVIQKISCYPNIPKATDSVRISALITDNISVTSATLMWGTSSGNLANSVKMIQNENGYTAFIPKNVNGSIICYSIAATDKDNNLTYSNENSYKVAELDNNKITAKNGRKNEYLTQAVLWQQLSGESQALYYQGYNIAKLKLDENLKKLTGKKKKAIVVDIDETLLNNSPIYGKSILSDSVAGSPEWINWINKAIADTLPGALDFLKYAGSKGIEIFYISNRSVSDVPATLVNLKKFNFPNADDQHTLFMEKTGSKEDRRNKVAASFEIVLLCGDNLGDFSFVFENRDFKSITDSVCKYKNEFGKRFIVLPNPMYGSWEHTVYGKSVGEKDSIRHTMIKGY